MAAALVVCGVRSQLLQWMVVALVCGVCASLLWRRAAGDVDGERTVWRWFVGAAAVVATGALTAAVVTCLPVPAADRQGLADTVFGVATLSALPMVYQGLIQWNRYRTATADNGDWLNGVSATLAIAAGSNLVLAWTGSPITTLPWWQLQGALLNAGGAAVLLGTGCTVAVLGGLQRDGRVWAISAALAVLAVAEGAGLAHGAGSPWPRVGWVAMATVLLCCAGSRSVRGAPQSATTQAPTVGALVVLLASVAVLALQDVQVGPSAAGAASPDRMHLPTLFAVLAVLGVSTRILHLVRDLAQLAQSRHEARTDDLTGIANRRALTARLDELVSRDAQASLVILDLDRFKGVNDQYGHAAGDALLRTATVRLSALLPQTAMLARLGGDEFAVLLEGPLPGAAGNPVDALQALAETLAAAITRPVTFGAQLVRVGASLGLARLGPDVTGEELMRRADRAMYQAKTSGGGVHWYDAELDAASREQDTLLQELRSALDPDVAPGHCQLEAHYQPQLDVRSGDVVGVEALVRWRHPRLGLLAPDAFLELVEQHGLMGQLTTTVLWQATGQAARWQAQGRPLRVSVNLSPSCLAHPGLLPLVHDVLVTTGLDPGRLVLEITETMLMADPDQALATTNAIARLGVGISIDDYGTGYSSLAYLNDLPACELKLDRFFTARLLTDERTTAIVTATVELAHRLGLRLLAEGVEDDATLQALRAVGCDETQGYLHARPMHADALHAWFDRRALVTDALPR